MIDTLLVEVFGLGGWGLFLASLILHEQIIKPAIAWAWDSLFDHSTKHLKANSAVVYEEIDAALKAGESFFEGFSAGSLKAGVDTQELSERQQLRSTKWFRSNFDPDIYSQK